MKEILIKIEGMECTGCEKRVENGVKQIEGVEKAIANHKEGIMRITLNKEIDENVIKEKIEDIGFKVKK